MCSRPRVYVEFADSEKVSELEFFDSQNPGVQPWPLKTQKVGCCLWKCASDIFLFAFLNFKNLLLLIQKTIIIGGVNFLFSIAFPIKGEL